MLLEFIDVEWNEAKLDNISVYEIEEIHEHICTYIVFLLPLVLFL